MAEGGKPNETRASSAPRRIAREARRRIELVASRIPRTAPFRKYARGEPEDTDRVVVISDTHFGDPCDVLTSHDLIDSLIENIKALGGIDELVLLGDVFDFWKAPIDEAMVRGRDFMSALFMLDNVERMVYLPGNHDHHVFRMYYDEQVRDHLRRGDLEAPELTMPITANCPVMDVLKPRGARVPLFMIYPIHQVSVRGARVLLTHGHLLGFFERSLWRPRHSLMATLILKKNESLGFEDMEKFLSPFYEMLALSAMVPGVTAGGYRVYRLLSRTGTALGLQGASRESAYRNTTIEENAAEIEALLDHFYMEKLDYFVYGHTHRAGKLILPVSRATAINTGCWLTDDAAQGITNTILEIAGEARLIQIQA